MRKNLGKTISDSDFYRPRPKYGILDAVITNQKAKFDISLKMTEGKSSNLQPSFQEECKDSQPEITKLQILEENLFHNNGLICVAKD